MQSPTLIDSLPPDAMRNMFRFFSKRPLDDNWVCFMKFSDVHRIYLTKGALTDECRRLFASISGGPTPKGKRLKDRRYLSLCRCPACVGLLDIVCGVGGPCIKRLYLDVCLSNGAVFSMWMSGVAPQELVVDHRCRFSLVPLIKAFGSKLRVLDVAFTLSEEEMELSGAAASNFAKW